jgi:DNA repair photolyase
MSLLFGVSDAYPYAPLQMHDSWLAVDPVIGCKASCAYCLLRLANWTGVRPEVVRTVDEIVSDLLHHKYFRPNTTRLCFGTRTDVLLPEVTPYALQFLAALDERGLRNPVALISKLEVGEATAAALSRLTSVRVVFLASWSALPAGVEKGVPRDGALRTMSRLKAHGVPCIHYFRPLVPANTTDETFRHVLRSVAGRAVSTVHVGIKLNPNLRRHYAEHPVLEPAADVEADYGTWTPDGAVARLRQLAADEFPSHPLYEHTSCAMSHALREPDDTATFHRGSVCLPSRCPPAQRNTCAEHAKPPTADAVRATLRSMGLPNSVDVHNGTVRLSGQLGQEDYCHLLHTINAPIECDVAFFRVFRGGIFDLADAQTGRSVRGSDSGIPSAQSGHDAGS